MKRAFILTALLLLLCACGKGALLPGPEDIYDRLRDEVSMPEMLEMTAEETEGYLGVVQEDYTGCLHATAVNALLADELVIIAARDSESADRIKQQLQTRLDYKARSAENYLPENLPVIESAVIRQDGLTVSLIVSGSVEEIQAVYAALLSK